MTSITQTNIHNFCRLCLRQLPTGVLYKPNHNIEKENISELIQKTVDFSIFLKSEQKENYNVSFEYPKAICHCCYIKMIALAAFRDKCIIAAGVVKMSLTENLNEIAIAKLKDFCRICLKKCTDPINNEENTANLIYLEQCTGLQMADDDDKNEDVLEYYDRLLNDKRFPQKLCIKCSSKLKTFLAFRTMARKSEEYIKNLFYEEIEENDHWSESDFIQSAVEFEIITNDAVQEIISKSNHVSDEDNKYGLKNSVDVLQSCNEYVINENLKNKEKEELDAADETCTTSSKNTSLCNYTKNRRKNRQNSLCCPHCEKVFYREISLDGHIRSVHEGLDRPFICKLCPSTFKHYTALYRHIKLLHKFKVPLVKNINIFATPKKNAHICFQCSRQFKRKDILRNHMNTIHVPSRDLCQFKCKFCGKGFGCKAGLQRHESNHSNERPFACEFCTKRYNCKSELKIHIERHTTNPELLCPICKRGKSNAEELQKHIAMHEANRRHQCPKCGQIFQTMLQLKTHDSSFHLKLRPFKCSFCEKNFAVKTSKMHHEKTIHGQFPASSTKSTEDNSQ